MANALIQYDDSDAALAEVAALRLAGFTGLADKIEAELKPDLEEIYVTLAQWDEADEAERPALEARLRGVARRAGSRRGNGNGNGNGPPSLLSRGNGS